MIGNPVFVVVFYLDGVMVVLSAYNSVDACAMLAGVGFPCGASIGSAN